MSTLEKAFLKATELEGEQTSPTPIVKSREERSEPSDKNSSGSVPRQHQVEQKTDGNSISLMDDATFYSTETLIEKQIIFSKMKDAQLLDRYRNIRTNLLSGAERNNFVTLVTSVVPDGGSSLVAANLAATFSLDTAKTTMLIEADISNSELSELFDMSDREGLIDYLSTAMGDCSQILNQTGVPRLRFVPSGLAKENSAEYFTSVKMSEFIKELVERYPDRYPIINAPCVVNSADTRILLELCEKVILVIPYGKCSDEQIMHAAFTIGEKKLAGVVLDGF